MSQHDNSLIKTPRQLIIVVTLAFIVPVILIILLATYVARSTTSGTAGSDAMSERSIAERMRPVGMVVLADSSVPKSLQTGEAVYAAACSACHAAGIAGAPRTGDAAAWAPRLKQGFDLLVKHAVEGFKAMPPKGGNANLDPIEVARAVAFMGNQSGGKFKEPAAPAATAAPAAVHPRLPFLPPTSPRSLPPLPRQERPPAQRAQQSPPSSTARQSMRRVAMCVMRPVLPGHRSSVTNRRGRRVLHKASMGLLRP